MAKMPAVPRVLRYKSPLVVLSGLEEPKVIANAVKTKRPYMVGNDVTIAKTQTISLVTRQRPQV
jgi:hypothetical protein